MTRSQLRAFVPALVAAAALLGAMSALAQAATNQAGRNTRSSYQTGIYNGQIDQGKPQAYTGHIHLVVGQGQLTGLRFTAGTLCGKVWVVVKDHKVPALTIKVNSTGGFYYRGTTAGRTIRIMGRVKGNRIRGSFFQAFAWGQSTCTMGQPAFFTATAKS